MGATWVRRSLAAVGVTVGSVLLLGDAAGALCIGPSPMQDDEWWWGPYLDGYDWSNPGPVIDDDGNIFLGPGAYDDVMCRRIRGGTGAYWCLGPNGEGADDVPLARPEGPILA